MITDSRIEVIVEVRCDWCGVVGTSTRHSVPEQHKHANISNLISFELERALEGITDVGEKCWVGEGDVHLCLECAKCLGSSTGVAFLRRKNKKDKRNG